MLAQRSVGEGVNTHLFFTFWGFDMITKSRMHDLKFSPAGNTALHLPVKDVRLPQALAPAMTAPATAEMNQLDESQLRDDVDGIINASQFIEMTKGAQIIFI